MTPYVVFLSSMLLWSRKSWKTKRRKLVRVMIKSGLQCDKDSYHKVRDAYSALLNETRKTYYFNLIDECAGDSKKLFRIVNSLSKERQDTVLPQSLVFSFIRKSNSSKLRLTRSLSTRLTFISISIWNWRTFLRSRKMKFGGSSLNLLMLVANWIPSLCGLLNSAVMYWPQSLLKW